MTHSASLTVVKEQGDGPYKKAKAPLPISQPIDLAFPIGLK